MPNYRTLEDVWEGPEPSLPHVLLVVDQFPRSLGGGERIVLRLAELLPRYGFRASVLTFAIHQESPGPPEVHCSPRNVQETFMTRILATLALGSALAIAAPLAHADQISYVGADTFSNNGSLVFSNPALQIGTASGIFAPYAGSTATFTSFNFITYATGSPQIIITDAAGANVLNFTLNTTGYSYSLIPVTTPGHAPGEEDLVILGNGTFSFTGSSAVAGSFDLNTQGVPGGPATVSFAETSYAPIAATPEPSSLMLLGTGMLGTAGMFFRRRRNS